MSFSLYPIQSQNLKLVATLGPSDVSDWRVSTPLDHSVAFALWQKQTFDAIIHLSK